MNKQVLVFSLVFTLLLFLPIFYGYTSDDHFMGIITGIGDSNTYFDYMNQAQEGDFFFVNSYTSEDMPAYLIRPLFWAMGMLSFLFPSILVWHLVRALFVIGFILLLFHVTSYVTKDLYQRYAMVVLTCLGSGLGWFVLLLNHIFGTRLFSTDLWLTESLPFLTFNGAPHFIASYIMILAILFLFYRGVMETSYKPIWIATLLCFLLGFIHIYDIVTIYLVTAVFGLYQFIRTPKWELVFKAAIFYGLSIWSALYYFWVFTFDPIYSYWSAQNTLLSPPLSNYLFGFGFVLVFALMFIVVCYKRLVKEPFILYLSIWLVVNFILLYAPIDLQRRFAEGIFVPMSLLAVLGIWHIAQSRKILVLGCLLICLPTTVILFGQLFDISSFGYLDDDDLTAMQWLDQLDQKDAVILAGEKFSIYTPRLTSHRTYVAHWAQTVDYSEKKSWYEKFKRGSGDIPEDIDYIVSTDQLDLVEVYSNPTYTIYQHGDN